VTGQAFYSILPQSYEALIEWVVVLEKSPGGFTISHQSRLYLITQENCVNCPAAKAVVKEAFDADEIDVQTVDLQEMDPDLEFRLLENQVFIASTPSIIVEDNGTLKMLYSGTVPTVEGIRKDLGMK
jgi:glutaredoxin